MQSTLFITLAEIKSHKTLLIGEPNCRQGPQSEKSILFQAIITPTPKNHTRKKNKNMTFYVSSKKSGPKDISTMASGPVVVLHTTCLNSTEAFTCQKQQIVIIYFYVSCGMIYVPIFKAISIMYITDISEAQGK